MSTAKLEFVFDGENVKDGTMDVLELAPALLAAGNLVRTANREINGPNTTASLRVDAQFESGSFDISLILDQDLIDQAKHLLLGDDGRLGAEELVKVLFGVGVTASGAVVGLMRLMKVLKGQRPDNVKIEQNTTIINLGDGDVVKADNLAVKLYEDDSIREYARRILKPLARKGIESFEVKRGEQSIERFSREDAEQILSTATAVDLSVAAPREGVEVSHRNTVLRLVRLSFRRGHKYQVAEGDTEFYVKIEDDDFLNAVENDQISFSAHGRLRVLLRQEITPGDKKDTVEHFVEQVIQYEPPKPPPTQGKLVPPT